MVAIPGTTSAYATRQKWLRCAAAAVGAGHGVLLTAAAGGPPAEAAHTTPVAVDTDVPIWRAHAVAQVLITAGFFVGRVPGNPAEPRR